MNEIAYLAGVLKGDGWCTQALGLRVNDLDFAQAFSAALETVYGITVPPRKDERGYWLVRTSNKTRRFDNLIGYEPAIDDEKAAWLRGLFDSEGNAQLRLSGTSENSYGRRISFYSTNIVTLERAQQYLIDIGINTILRPTKNSVGHKGTKVVYELVLRASKDQYSRFGVKVGSSIARKQTIIDAIPGSYQVDNAYLRAAQLKGAAANKRRTIEITLPTVLQGIRELIEQGVKPTQRACRLIPKYSTVQGNFPQSVLIEMALKK